MVSMMGNDFLDDMVEHPERTDTAPEENTAVLAVGPVALNSLEVELTFKCEQEKIGYAHTRGFSLARFAIIDEQTGDEIEVTRGATRYATPDETAALNAIGERWEVAIAAARSLGPDGESWLERSKAWDDPANVELIKILEEWNHA